MPNLAKVFSHQGLVVLVARVTDVEPVPHHGSYRAVGDLQVLL